MWPNCAASSLQNLLSCLEGTFNFISFVAWASSILPAWEARLELKSPTHFEKCKTGSISLLSHFLFVSVELLWALSFPFCHSCLTSSFTGWGVSSLEFQLLEYKCLGKLLWVSSSSAAEQVALQGGGTLFSWLPLQKSRAVFPDWFLRGR